MNALAKTQPNLLLQNHDAGNAERFVREHGKNVRYCHDMGKWFEWDGTIWKPDRDGRVIERAKRSARGLYDEVKIILECGGDARDLERHARYSNGERGINGTLAMARSMVPIRPEDLNRDRWLVTTNTHTIDLRTGEARRPRREDFITVQLPHDYDELAQCYRWKLFLGEVTQDRADIAEFLQRWCGYCLTGLIREHALVMLVGGGCNGKSVFVETVRHVMGDDQVATAPPALLLASKGERHPTELRRLFAKRLVIASELPKGAAFSEERVKSLTGGDTISARGMREDFFDFDPTHKLMVCTNDMPRVRDMSAGFWRRMRVVPFDVSFEGRADRTLTDTLRAEAPGILAWMVQGAVRWAQDGLGQPDEVKAATTQYREAEDQVGRYLAEREWTERVSSKELFADYQQWCDDEGEKPYSQRVLGLELGRRGWVQAPRTNQGKGWFPRRSDAAA